MQVATPNRKHLIALAAEVSSHEARDGEATEGPRHRERLANEEGCRAGP